MRAPLILAAAVLLATACGGDTNAHDGASSAPSPPPPASPSVHPSTPIPKPPTPTPSITAVVLGGLPGVISVVAPPQTTCTGASLSYRGSASPSPGATPSPYPTPITFAAVNPTGTVDQYGHPAWKFDWVAEPAQPGTWIFTAHCALNGAVVIATKNLVAR